jgi:phage-related protein
MVTDNLSASQLADRCIAEAKRLFKSQANWKPVEVLDKNIKVETIPLEGGYANSGVHLVRGTGIIPASAEKFFKFQISRDGFQSIDEYLVNHRNVNNFKWVTRPEFAHVSVPQAHEPFPEDSPYQLMLNRVEWKYPIKRREFVALDVVHSADRILISKSSLSPLRPGGSRYQNIVPKDERTPYIDPVDPVPRSLVRAVQYYASHVEPIDDTSCKLTMVTWGEMCDSYSAWWVNLFNAHVFITPKFDRFIRVMGGESLFEESKIMDNAWRLLKIIPNLKPDAVAAASSDFVAGKKIV